MRRRTATAAAAERLSQRVEVFDRFLAGVERTRGAEPQAARRHERAQAAFAPPVERAFEALRLAGPALIEGHQFEAPQRGFARERREELLERGERRLAGAAREQHDRADVRRAGRHALHRERDAAGSRVAPLERHVQRSALQTGGTRGHLPRRT